MASGSVVGLDIGTSAIRAAEVKIRKSPRVVARLGQTVLGQGVVKAGEIIDEVALGQSIGQMWKQSGFSAKRVTVGVANQRIVARQVELPQMPEAELAQGLAFLARDYVPFAIEDAVMDFQVQDYFLGENSQPMMRVLLVAAQREMIDMVVRSLQIGGIKADAIDLVPLALIRTLGSHTSMRALDAIADQEAQQGDAEAIVDVGAGITNIVVQSRGLAQFVRILVGGGQRVTDALVASLGTTWEEAETLKWQAGQAESLANPEVRKVIDASMASIVGEVKSSLDYYISSSNSMTISRIVLTGGGSQTPNLVSQMAAATGINTEKGHPFAAMKLGSLGLSPEQLVQAETIAAAPLGLTLGDAL